MANASTPTLLPLDQYADILGIDPRHFNQVRTTAYPEEGACSDIWWQFAWQHPDKASREDLARAIAQAERLIANYIGFWPAPTWITNETHRYPYQQRWADGAMGTAFFPALSQTRRKTVKTNWRYWADGGRRRVDEIELGAAVVYSTPDGDAFNELATIGVVDTDVVEEYEVAVFPDTDTSPQNRIRNLTVTLGAAGVITITGQSSLFVDPAFWAAGTEADAVIDGDALGMPEFLATVNVYRIYTSDEDSTYAPVEFAWQNSTLVPFSVAYGVQQLWNPELGVISPIPATWDADDEEWDVAYWCLQNEPHLIRLWYYAGWQCSTQGLMEEPFARAVAALATALLMKPICGCDQAELLAQYWQERPNPDTTTGYGQIAYERLNCPWGTQNGAWEAYRICQEYMAVEGVSVP